MGCKFIQYSLLAHVTSKSEVRECTSANLKCVASPKDMSFLDIVLQNVNDEKVKKKLIDVTQFDQKFLDELEQEYPEACRAGNGEPNGYCSTAYRLSKILLNSYSRLLALRLANQPDRHKIYLHVVHPGFVRTDIYEKLVSLLDEKTFQKKAASGHFNHEEVISVQEGADIPVWLSLAPAGNQPPCGVFGTRWKNSTINCPTFIHFQQSVLRIPCLLRA